MNRLQAEALTAATRLRDIMYREYGVDNARELTKMMKGTNEMSLALLDVVRALDNIDEQEHIPEEIEKPVPRPVDTYSPVPPTMIGTMYSEDEPPFGLTAVELKILRVLYEHNGVRNSKQLYEDINSTHFNVHNSVLWDSCVRLEMSGMFVTITKLGRSRMVQLTNKGRSILTEAIRIITAEKEK